MKFGKRVSIKLIDEAEEAYKKLSQIVGYQKEKDRLNSDEIKLWNGIQRALDLVADNPFYGENAKKDQIPKYYREKYEVDAIFIVDLPLYWRMIYTLESDKVEIVAFVLDIYSHDEYNKRFGFRKR